MRLQAKWPSFPPSVCAYFSNLGLKVNVVGHWSRSAVNTCKVFDIGGQLDKGNKKSKCYRSKFNKSGGVCRGSAFYIIESIRLKIELNQFGNLVPHINKETISQFQKHKVSNKSNKPLFFSLLIELKPKKGCSRQICGFHVMPFFNYLPRLIMRSLIFRTDICGFNGFSNTKTCQLADWVIKLRLSLFSSVNCLRL